MYRVRGDHLRGIKIVAPATQKHVDTSQPACIGSGENISEASKLLHLPHKTHAYGDKLDCRVISDQNVGRVTEGVLVWPGPGNAQATTKKRIRCEVFLSEQGHKKNTNRSLATLPNEVGRVTSDQKVGRVTSDHLTDDLGGKTPLFLGNIPNPMKNKNRLSPFVFGRKLCSYVASVRYFDKKKAVTMIDVTVFTHS